jgi:hypothetical protein
MYSQQHYLTRSILAQELSEMPENCRRKKAYLALSLNWKKMADIAAKATYLPRQRLR